MPRSSSLLGAALLLCLALSTSATRLLQQNNEVDVAEAPSGLVVLYKENANPDAKANDFTKKNKDVGKKAVWGSMKGAHLSLPPGLAKKNKDDLIKKLKADPDVVAVAEDAPAKIYQEAVPTGVTEMYSVMTSSGTSLTSALAASAAVASKVRIAVIDTGVAAHTDLSVHTEGFSVFKKGKRMDWTDRNGHGTHCAGTAAARYSNGVGVAGVSPGTTIVPVKVLGDNGSGSMSGIIAGLDWVRSNAARLNIKVASMSLGGGKYDPLNTAVARLYASGIAVAVAAGNENQDLMNVSPASADGVIRVTAIDPTTRRAASFSNYMGGSGPETNVVAAPGTSIKSTYIGNSYATLSGTSMATPHVAGLMAQLFARGDCTTAACVYARLASCTKVDVSGSAGSRYGYEAFMGAVC
mmetsp:Transcript_12380/g.30395  ORF Transcript_12380/g.30395 Transcript_12380/m.30395 type:complete len:410 (-) Transcript_12380:625-1854(-)|eukprot:CAMPEP_0202860444 /NCGR_PEP_ID=MMETSP1391-20130828/2143_1 /ASSEMBLY_ACC=CAM_ASM_000867 /TAXON_ID=1034604 /ORGANISM="Chlamydomonas leiostraca, Strain SAG 11-49" /LENGTH=409 /DNA_ID=CAMNT_0049539607 /DNA_START=79 /DNA_END=1308 /DNA_ORIENTATION=+